MWTWVKWCDCGKGRGLWLRGLGGLATTDEAYVGAADEA